MRYAYEKANTKSAHERNPECHGSKKKRKKHPPEKRPLIFEVEVLPAARVVHHGRQALVQESRVLMEKGVQQRLVPGHESAESVESIFIRVSKVRARARARKRKEGGR